MVITLLANFAVMVVSAAVLGIGIWLRTRSDGVQCFTVLQWALIIVGAVILVVAFVGFVGLLCDSPLLLGANLFVVFLSMLGLLALTIFAFIVTNKNASDAVSGVGIGDYRIGDYSNWLQNQVTSNSTWKTVRSCVLETDPCKDLDADYPTEASLTAAKLTHLQAGCCIPPTDCGFTFVNATYFTLPVANTVNSTDADCARYNNSPTELCFDCDKCKAAVLENVQNKWRIIAFTNIGLLAFLFAMYSVGCCAYRRTGRGEAGGFTKGF